MPPAASARAGEPLGRPEPRDGRQEPDARDQRPGAHVTQGHIEPARISLNSEKKQPDRPRPQQSARPLSPQEHQASQQAGGIVDPHDQPMLDAAQQRNVVAAHHREDPVPERRAPEQNTTGNDDGDAAERGDGKRHKPHQGARRIEEQQVDAIKRSPDGEALLGQEAHRRQKRQEHQRQGAFGDGVFQEHPVSQDGRELSEGVIMQVVHERIRDRIGGDQEEQRQRDRAQRARSTLGRADPDNCNSRR